MKRNPLIPKISEDLTMSKRKALLIAQLINHICWEIAHLKSWELSRSWQLISAKVKLIYSIGDTDSDGIEDIEKIMSEYEIDKVRVCKKCLSLVNEGYLTPDGDVYCSPECLEMTEQEIANQYSDDKQDCIFWTDWSEEE